jgi:hypothetical protein
MPIGNTECPEWQSIEVIHAHSFKDGKLHATGHEFLQTVETTYENLKYI